jgi:hypothetical protein
MAILDFIRNRQRQASPSQAQAAKPVQQAPARQDVSKVIPASELAKAREIGDRLKRATMHMQAGASSGEGGSNAAMLQKQNNQDKVQAPMSPTDRFAGKTALQGKARGWER